MTLTIGSLFSGIGGLELGLERAGLGPVLWQCEINPFARQVLAKHWPTVTRYEDVTRPRDYPHVDVICGGFPCQDLSSAGDRRGIGGERSSLWYYYARIIAQVRPRFVVVENVRSGAPTWLPVVRRHLCAFGYRVRAMGIAASDIGAPHARKRVFVVGHSDHASEPTGAINAEASGVRPAPSDLRAGWPLPPKRLRVVDGIPGGVDRHLRALGNAVVPQCAEVVGRVIHAMAT